MKILRIIWASLVLTLLIYGVILMTLANAWGAPERSLEDILRSPFVLVLGVAGLASLTMAFVLPAGILRRNAAVPNIERTACVIQWALIESVAIYGVLASFILQDVRPFLGFAAVALAAFVMTFPTEEKLRRPSAL